jgi:uncharacterized membrane protein YoaK (UPF0700 family)
MDNVTILDLFLMLVGSSGEDHQANIDILRSLYERTHSFYLALLTATLVLAGTLIGAFISLLAQRQASSEAITVVIAIALAVLLAVLIAVIGRLNRVQRDYLDIIQVYNLLARFF